MSRYRVGCTGWGYDDWRGGFYPTGAEPREYLGRYARVFDTTEIDSAYYQAPSREQTARWADATPAGFLFASKFPGDVTHKASLRGVDDKVDAFLRALAPLRSAGKLGPLVLQMPASFTRTKGASALGAFLASFPTRDYRLAVELRHASWWVPDTFRALEAADASLVWSVTESGRAPPRLTSGTLYARLIGDRELTKFDRIQRDQSSEMRWWRDRFEDEGRSAREAFVYVNNHLMGFAPQSVRMMRDILGLPALDLGAAMRDPGQQRLF